MNGKVAWLLTGWLTVALLAVGVMNAQAPVGSDPQAPRGGEARPMEPTPELKPGLEKANELIGAKVVNDKQERLGTIEDIVLTPDRTKVNYLVLSHGGFWGFGGKLFAVPWSQFDLGAKDNVLVLKGITPADLENAKGFDKDHWPAAAHENWLGREAPLNAPPAPERTAGEVPRYEDSGEHRAHLESENAEARPDRPDSPGVGDTKAAKADLKYCKLSELVGLTIKNAQGEELGELEDIVIDLHEGKVAYAVLSMRSGFLGLNKELAAIPWSSFQVLPQLGTARLDADKETLQAIAFDEDEFPDLADREYSSRIHEQFGARPYWETYGFVPGADKERSDELTEEPTRELPKEDAKERPEVSPWKEGSEYDALYNPGKLQTIHGTIVSVGTFRPEGTSTEGLRLRIKTDEGKTVTVHAGPRPYVENQKIHFHYGDEVTVMGSPAKMGWHDVIVASQVRKGDDALDLRTKEGKPRWKVEDFKEDR